MEASRKYLLAVVGGIFLYAALLLTPYNYIIAPLVVGALIGLAAPGRGAAALLAGALDGILGLAIILAATSAYKAIALASGIGGPAAVAIMPLYHLLTPALAAYIAAKASRRSNRNF